MQLKRTQRLYAVLLSFAVYLLPLIGPHAFIFLGELIWNELTRGEREPLWVAADVGVALILQIITFVTLYGLFKRPTVSRVLLTVVATPFIVSALEYTYLVAIPSHFLIENDTAEERGDWPVECTARDVGLVEIPHPTHPLVWSELLVQASDGSYKLMRIPGCELMPLAVPQPKLQPGERVDFMVSVTYFVPNRGVIFSRQDTATGAFTWNHLFNDRITPIPGLHPGAAPILSLDGQWAAWLEKGSVAIERIDGNEAPLQVNLGNLDISSFALRTVDMERGEIELQSSDRRIVAGLDGRIKTSDTLPLMWDAYREDGPYRASWNLDGRSGTHNVLKGRSINSAAISPSGDLVAISVATALSIGHIRDSVYILRTIDGTEVFRRYLPAYTRTPVFFPTDDLFVYTADGHTIVSRVIRQ